MTTEIVHCDDGVILLGGGQIDPADVAIALTIAPRIVAADGGGDRALALDLLPEAVIGDMDSLSPAGQAALAGRVHPVAEQDSTDFGKCLRLVRARFYLCLGFTGLRLDHTLSALNEVAARPGQVILLIAEDEVIFRLPARFALALPPGERFSLFPMGAARGRSTGLHWPIDGIDFAPGGRIGTSNKVTGQVELSVTGPMLALLPKAHLRRVLDALLPPPDARGE